MAFETGKYLQGIFEKLNIGALDESGQITIEQIVDENAETPGKSDESTTETIETKSEPKADTGTEVKKVEGPTDVIKKIDPESNNEMLEIRRQLAEAQAQIMKLTSVTKVEKKEDAPEDKYSFSEPEDIEDFSDLIVDKDKFVSWLRNYILHTTRPMVDENVTTTFKPVKSMLAHQKLVKKIASLVQEHNNDFPALMEDFKAVVKENPDKLFNDDLNALYWMAKQRQESRGGLKIVPKTVTKKEIDDEMKNGNTSEKGSAPIQENMPKVAATNSREAAEQAVSELFS